jgi:hypothetical protein
VELPTEVLSVNDFDLSEVAVYPNPTNGILNLRGLEAGTSVDVIDLQGRVLIQNTAGAETTLDMGGLSAGMYQLVFRNGNQIIGSTKVIRN